LELFGREAAPPAMVACLMAELGAGWVVCGRAEGE